VEPESVGSAEEAPEEASLSYPLVTDGSESVTVWVSLPPHVAPYMEDVADSACYRAAAEATGITMNTTTVSTAVAEEQFQLLCASGTTGDYDFIVGATNSYGSADAAIEDEILLDLSDYLAEYMPDYNSFLQSDEEVRKLLTTDSGTIADIAGRATGGRAQGFGIRKDWLDDAGLDIPTTYDQLYEVLTVFKNSYNCPEPLLMYSTGFLDNDFLCAGLGMTQNGYYVEDGIVRFAYLEDSFREYCQLIYKWYSEGLLSKDFLSNTQGAGISYDTQMQDGTAGVFMTGVDIFSSSSAAGASDPNWEAVPMADVTLTGTETITLGNTPNSDPLSNSWSVTTGVTEDRLTNVLGFANWFFTEEGSLACNFGIEGEGFEYVDGEPHLTELVTNNPDGLGSFISESLYLNWCAPYCLDTRYYDSIYDTQAQAEAADIWNSNRNNTQQYHGALTSDESTDYSAIYSDIETYISNMSISFMTGAADIETQWDTFVSTLESMNIEGCIAIKQAAYDRYLQR
jgi:putative aldouronate transport system substrate-binding protein